MSRIVQAVFPRPAEQTDLKSKVAIGKRMRLKNLRCALALHGLFSNVSRGDNERLVDLQTQKIYSELHVVAPLHNVQAL
jgi:hypothetical protein